MSEDPVMAIIANSEDIDRGMRSLLRRDPTLRPVAQIAGEVPLRLSSPDFAGLAGIVVAQQVSKASADAIYRRLCTSMDRLDAQSILAVDAEVLLRCGLSRPKLATLRAIAQAIDAGDLDFGTLGRLAPDEAVRRMTAIRGIGTWTAEVYLLFCIGHADILPAGDMALQEAARVAFNLEQRPRDRELRAISQKWSPWRGVASRLLWAYYAAIRSGRDATPA
jgi:DNA-3-methyladenine glycosylase II